MILNVLKTAENGQKIMKKKAENKDRVSVVLLHHAWTNKQKSKQQDYSP